MIRSVDEFSSSTLKSPEIAATSLPPLSISLLSTFSELTATTTSQNRRSRDRLTRPTDGEKFEKIRGSSVQDVVVMDDERCTVGSYRLTIDVQVRSRIDTNENVSSVYNAHHGEAW